MADAYCRAPSNVTRLRQTEKFSMSKATVVIAGIMILAVVGYIMSSGNSAYDSDVTNDELKQLISQSALGDGLHIHIMASCSDPSGSGAQKALATNLLDEVIKDDPQGYKSKMTSAEYSRYCQDEVKTMLAEALVTYPHKAWYRSQKDRWWLVDANSNVSVIALEAR